MIEIGWKVYYFGYGPRTHCRCIYDHRVRVITALQITSRCHDFWEHSTSLPLHGLQHTDRDILVNGVLNTGDALLVTLRDEDSGQICRVGRSLNVSFWVPGPRWAGDLSCPASSSESPRSQRFHRRSYGNKHTYLLSGDPGTVRLTMLVCADLAESRLT